MCAYSVPKPELRAWVVNENGIKKKTIVGTTNLNGQFWKKYNEYCNSKGYTQQVSVNTAGSLAWRHPITLDTLYFRWCE